MDERPNWIDPLLARRVLCVLAASGALGLLVATFLPVLRLTAADPRALKGETTSYSGLDRHSVSLVVIAFVALPGALLALRGLRIAAVAVLLSALAALLIAVGVDLPALHQSGTLGADLSPANATPGSGYYVETLSAILLLLSGGGLLALQARWKIRDRGPVEQSSAAVDER